MKFGGWFLILGLLGCGSNQDPMGNLLGNPSLMPFGMMNLPLGSSMTGVVLNGPYTQASPYFSLTGSGFSLQTQIYAPISGLVVENLGTKVKILYNARVSVVLGGFSSSTFAGVYVPQGSVVGTVASLGAPVTFEIDVDGKPVCPLSFLSTQAKASLYSYSFSGVGANQYCN